MSPTAEEQENADPQNEDEPAEVALAGLKAIWPHLFTFPGLKGHHERLTGRNIREPFEAFIVSHLEFMLLFLTTASSANAENLILRMKVERHFDNVSNSMKMLLIYSMLANHFGEKEVAIRTTEVRDELKK